MKNRRELIHANFAAYRDLTWEKELAPKFKAEGVGGAELEGWRQSWNQFCEKRDWEWWLEKSAKLSNGELEKETLECRNEIAAIASKGNKERDAFQKILNGTHDTELHRDQQSKTRYSGMEM